MRPRKALEPRLRRLVARVAPNLATAAWAYIQLRRQSSGLARAGRDEREPAELVHPTPDGAVLHVGDPPLIDVRITAEYVTAIQKRDELLPLLEEIRRLEPRRVCEIGTSGGGTLYLLTRVSREDALVISVDLLVPLHTQAARARLARAGQHVMSISGDSHAPETKAKVQELLAGEPLDVLFIDGDHSYEGVRADFEHYSPLVRPGGLIALHDINSNQVEGGSAISGDVPRYWQELKAGRRTRELIADPEQDGYGIGVVYA
jgi:predicted O-methyltransferase YrrM